MARERSSARFPYPRAIVAVVVGVLLASSLAAEARDADIARADAVCASHHLTYSALATDLPPLRANGAVCVAPTYPQSRTTFAMEQEGGLWGAEALAASLLTGMAAALIVMWGWAAIRRDVRLLRAVARPRPRAG